jgi:hypothetical protein
MQKCRQTPTHYSTFLTGLNHIPSKLNIGPFEVPPHPLLIYIPTLARRSIRWLAEVEQDRRRRGGIL